MVSEAGRRPLTIAIDARQSVDGSAGGVSWVTEGLLRALADLGDGRERYLVLGREEQRERLGRLCGEGMELITEREGVARRAKRQVHRLVKRLPVAQLAVSTCRDALSRRNKQSGPAPRDAFLSRLDCDLIHFPSQRFFTTAVPSIYNPHDLQHLHYPEFFTPREYRQREWLYRSGCAAARRIAVSSDWVKRDLVERYGTDPNKIQVIPWGVEQVPEIVPMAAREAVRQRIGAPAQPLTYALYPAATWEHKNHLRLLDALAGLRDRDGVRLNLICCGHKTEFFPKIQRRVRALDLGGQVAFPGVLPREQLNALYLQALLVVIPSLFEASSALIREAWRWRCPIACAAVTSLPEQARDTALLFDPTHSDAIAEAMGRLAVDGRLRDDLVAKGSHRIARFPWSRTAAAYRALYRSVAGSPLGTDDRALLEHDWMTNP